MNDIFTPADLLLPKEGTDLSRWAVVACDQFSSQPEYWRAMEAFVGSAPSTLRLMLPEAYLGAADLPARQESMLRAMEAYLAGGVFRTVADSYVYVERTLPSGAVRRGLVGKLDLEAYDWTPGSESPVRATEATVAERLPVRTALRRQAALELPHIVLFMNDRADRVLAGAEPAEPLYDFPLYGEGGRLRGWRVTGPAARRLQSALAELPQDPLFAMGDGNHSLAAAKEHWEALKKAGAPMDHPARWALAELENLWDEAVHFYPIHRVLFGTDEGGFVRRLEGDDTGALVEQADRFCQEYIARHGGRVDYVHGEQAALEQAARPGGAALLLPAMDKGELFAHIRSQGCYPKKSFSVGQALDKRWYMECRRIRPGGAAG